MSARRLIPVLAVAGALAPAAAAQARPVDVLPGHAAIPRTATPVQPPVVPEESGPVVLHEGGGAGPATVIAVAGGTLLLGAATGFGAGGAVTRRRALGH
jgi:hypothetical protein